ncbi:MAG: c-type cytochrome [Nevskiales bacterium]|nr:c-type cytochrome [Nevskiales bacterium]
MRREVFAVLVLGVLGCEGRPAAVAPPPAPSGPPLFADAHLSAGRDVWMKVCRGCHELGVADAPKLGDRTAWASRIAQGRPVLYRHALEGFFGPRGTMMPPRGGNPDLRDDEVTAAVDYMVMASQ